MDYALLLGLAFLSIIWIYTRQYYAYHEPISFTTIPYSTELISNIKVPYKVKGHLTPFSRWDILYFKNNFGNKNIYVLHSPDPQCSVKNAETIPMTLDQYIDKYILSNEPQRTQYYFKSEDAYQFLKSIHLEKPIFDHFKEYLPHHTYFSTSFWLGPKGSTTTFHYDSDHSNFLCLLEGSKRIYLLSPEANHKMKKIKTSYGDYWSNLDMSDNRLINKMKEKKELYEIILHPGEIINIPRYVWHAVENLDNTVSFTFHYYTIKSTLLNISLIQ